MQHVGPVKDVDSGDHSLEVNVCKAAKAVRGRQLVLGRRGRYLREVGDIRKAR